MPLTICGKWSIDMLQPDDIRMACPTGNETILELAMQRPQEMRSYIELSHKGIHQKSIQGGKSLC
jgi:hypothetical protein